MYVDIQTKVGEDKNLCHYFIFVIKILTKMDITNTQIKHFIFRYNRHI